MDLSSLLDGVDAAELRRVLASVAENRDVWEHLGRLPDFFENFADTLAAAGSEAKQAAVALVGEDGQSGARGTLHDASGALGSISSSLDKGSARLAQAAEGVAKVPLMDKPAARFAGAAEEIGAATGNLGELAEAMQSIAATLESVGAALGRLGERLDDSGSQARGFLSA